MVTLSCGSLPPLYIHKSNEASTGTPSKAAENKSSALKRIFASVFEKDDQKVSRILDSFSQQHEGLRTLPDHERQETARKLLRDLEGHASTFTFLRVFKEHPGLSLQHQKLYWLFGEILK
jgi:hypothetical protein